MVVPLSANPSNTGLYWVLQSHWKVGSAELVFSHRDVCEVLWLLTKGEKKYIVETVIGSCLEEKVNGQVPIYGPAGGFVLGDLY